MRAVVRALLRWVFPARSPKRVAHGVYVTRSRMVDGCVAPSASVSPTVRADLEDDTRIIAPVDGEDRGDETRPLSAAELRHATERAADRFPHRPASPRHRRDVPTGWARVCYGVRRRMSRPTDNGGRFR